MIFDKSKVFTALNADELKVGSKVIIANNLQSLMEKVDNDSISILLEIEDACKLHRFVIRDDDYAEGKVAYNLAYLVEEPQEDYLKWTDLKVGDILRKEQFVYMIGSIDHSPGTEIHVYAVGYGWVHDEDLRQFEILTEE